MSHLSAEAKRTQQNARLLAAMGLLFGKLAAEVTPTFQLSEIATTGSGGTPSRHNPNYFGGTIPWIKSGDLTDGPITKVEEFITEDGLNNSAARLFPRDTVAVALYGATVGKTGILTFPAASNQAVCAVIPKDEKVASRYLFWFLRFKRKDFLSQSFGGAQPNISQALLRAVFVPVPSTAVQQAIVTFLEAVEQRQQGKDILLPNLPSPLSEQRRLVERIDALAAKIEEAKGLRDTADEGNERLLISMAHRGDLTVREKLDLGWSNVTLNQVMTEQREPVPVDTSESYPNLGIYSFGRGLFKKQDINGLETSAKTLYRVHQGQFIYSRLFAFEGAYGVVTEEFDKHLVSNEYPTFKLDQARVMPAFLRAYFKSQRIWVEVATGSKGLGDRRQRVHPEQILAHKLLVPPTDWQQRMTEVQERLDSESSSIGQVASELNAMLPAILDRAFRGEL